MFNPLEIIINQLKQATGTKLWLVDENFSDLPLPSALIDCSVITNRVDLYRRFINAQWSCDFNDFDFSAIKDGSLNFIALRIPKEKALIHHVINQVALKLAPEGCLFLLGHKSEGIRTINKKTKRILGGSLLEKKLGNDYWQSFITLAPQHPREILDDENYTQLRQVTHANQFSYLSKPGIFGWKKIDLGSELLVKAIVAEGKIELPFSGAMLDLGCGYGYLSLSCAGDKTNLTCTDNNAAALQACKANLAPITNQLLVTASDAGDDLTEKYKLILCNPPFHAGFVHASALTERFISNAQRLTASKGACYFVVNQHVPLETLATSFFNQCQILDVSHGFKVIKLTQPKPKFR